MDPAAPTLGLTGFDGLVPKGGSWADIQVEDRRDADTHAPRTTTTNPAPKVPPERTPTGSGTPAVNIRSNTTLEPRWTPLPLAPIQAILLPLDVIVKMDLDELTRTQILATQYSNALEAVIHDRYHRKMGREARLATEKKELVDAHLKILVQAKEAKERKLSDADVIEIKFRPLNARAPAWRASAGQPEEPALALTSSVSDTSAAVASLPSQGSHGIPLAHNGMCPPQALLTSQTPYNQPWGNAGMVNSEMITPVIANSGPYPVYYPMYAISNTGNDPYQGVPATQLGYPMPSAQSTHYPTQATTQYAMSYTHHVGNTQQAYAPPIPQDQPNTSYDNDMTTQTNVTNIQQGYVTGPTRAAVQQAGQFPQSYNPHQLHNPQKLSQYQQSHNTFTL